MSDNFDLDEDLIDEDDFYILENDVDDSVYEEETEWNVYEEYAGFDDPEDLDD